MAFPRTICHLVVIALLTLIRLASAQSATSAPASPLPYQPAPEIAALLQSMPKVPLELETQQEVFRFWSQREAAVKPLHAIPMDKVVDLLIPSRGHQIPIRVYTPLDKSLARDARLPVLIYVHGGGWTLGSVNTYDSITRQLARQIPALVVSVDYRLAPENPFPAPSQDVYTAVQWVILHADQIGADPSRLAIAGDSAGGALAAATTLSLLRQHQSHPLLQVLFYPSTDIGNPDPQRDYPSYRQYGTGYYLTAKAIEGFRRFYLPDRNDWSNPDASPLRAPDLHGMPPTLVIAAGCDPLRDEGKAYADKLKAQGVPVTYRLEPTMIHGFLGFFNAYPPVSPYAQATLDYAAKTIHQAFNNAPATSPAGQGAANQ